jgi:hypothetical protein
LSSKGRGSSRGNAAGVTKRTYRPIPEDDIEVIDSTDFGASSSTRQPMNGSEQNGNKITEVQYLSQFYNDN